VVSNRLAGCLFGPAFQLSLRPEMIKCQDLSKMRFLSSEERQRDHLKHKREALTRFQTLFSHAKGKARRSSRFVEKRRRKSEEQVEATTQPVGEPEAP
jgi:hypothetical protein